MPDPSSDTAAGRALPSGVVDHCAADGAGGRYELVVDGIVAHADYLLQGDTITFTHTIVPPEIGGRGVGGRLVMVALDDAEARHLRIVPECSFVKRAVAARQRHGA